MKLKFFLRKTILLGLMLENQSYNFLWIYFGFVGIRIGLPQKVLVYYTEFGYTSDSSIMFEFDFKTLVSGSQLFVKTGYYWSWHNRYKPVFGKWFISDRVYYLAMRDDRRYFTTEYPI